MRDEPFGFFNQQMNMGQGPVVNQRPRRLAREEPHERSLNEFPANSNGIGTAGILGVKRTASIQHVGIDFRKDASHDEREGVTVGQV